MSARSWRARVRLADNKEENHLVWAFDAQNAEQKMIKRGYTIVSVTLEHVFQSVNQIAEDS